MGKQARSSFVFFVQSALLWSCVPIVYSFLPAYLDQSGFRESQIGVLLALGPLMSILLQPFIGILVDRSRYKNTLLILINAGTMVSILLFPLHDGLLHVALASFLLASFQAAIISVSEAITLEGLDRIQKPYGPVRLAGTLGYAVVSVIAGFFMKKDARAFFYITAITAFFSILSAWSLPKVAGHQAKPRKVPATVLFKDRGLVLLMAFSMVSHMGISFYQNFFPIYFSSIGGTSDVLGLLYFISAMSELPFLLYADRIEKKLGIHKTLAFSTGIIGARFVLLYFIKSPVLMYPVMLLNGLTYIVFSFSMAVHINRTVPLELRATGQTIHGMCMALGRILGSVLGGYLIEAIGLLNALAGFALLSLAAILMFIIAGSILAKTHSSPDKQAYR